MAKNMRDLQFMSLNNDQLCNYNQIETRSILAITVATNLIETDALIDHLKVLASVFIKIMAKMCEFISLIWTKCKFKIPSRIFLVVPQALNVIGSLVFSLQAFWFQLLLEFWCIIMSQYVSFHTPLFTF